MNKNYRFIGWIVIVVLIGGFYAYYFLMYIPHRESQLFERGFRILTDYGDNMREKEQYLKGQFRNHVMNAKFTAASSPNDSMAFINNYLAGINSGFRIDTTSSNSKQELSFDLPESIGMPSSLLPDLTYFEKNNYRIYIETYDFLEGLKYDRIYESIFVFDTASILNYEPPSSLQLNHKRLLASLGDAFSGSVQKIMVNDEEKHLLILPYRFSGSTIYLAGLINQDVFTKKTRVINIELLFILAGLLIIVLISIPIFKLFLLSSQERIQPLDTDMGTLSLILLTSVSLILVFAYGRQQIVVIPENKERLCEISKSLENHFLSDMEEIVSIYSILGKNIDTGKYAFISRQFDKIKTTQINYAPINEAYFGEEDIDKKNYYPIIPLNDIAFIEPDGIARKIISKNYTLSKQSNRIILSERNYFKNIKNPEASWLYGDSLPFFLESIQAYNSGEGEAAFSFRFENAKFYVGSDKKDVVQMNPRGNSYIPVKNDSLVTDYVVITSTLPSLYKQILPSDIQFAIIDQNGATLFHSEHSRNLHENLFVEINDKQLPSFSKLKRSKTMAVNYHGRDWYAHIKPIPNTQLNLVTFLSRDKMREANARLILISIYLLIIYMVFVWLGILIINSMSRRNLFLRQKNYLYRWLVFNPYYQKKYIILYRLFILLVIGQTLAFFILDDIRSTLMFQVFNISISVFVSTMILESNDDRVRFLKKLWLTKKQLTSLIFSLIILAFIISTFVSEGRNKLFYVALSILLITAFLAWLINRLGLHDQIHTGVNKRTSLRYFRVFTALWLGILAIAPTAHFIKVVQDKEEILWNRFELQHLAIENSRLLKDMHLKSGDNIYSWFKRIQGNGLDNVFVEVCTVPDTLTKIDSNQNTLAAKSECMHIEIPERDTSLHCNKTYPYEFLRTDFLDLFDVDLQPFITDKDQTGNYSFDAENEISVFLNPGDRVMKIRREKPQHAFINKSLAYYLILFLVLAIVLYVLFSYLIRQLLYTHIWQWTDIKNTDWKTFMDNYPSDHILLITSNYEAYLKEFRSLSGFSEKSMATIFEERKQSPNTQAKVAESIVHNNLFVYGIEDFAADPLQHDEVLNALNALLSQSETRLIVCLPFELEFIRHVLKESTQAKGGQALEVTKAEILLYRWEYLFRNCLSYTGRLKYHEVLKPAYEANKETISSLLEQECILEPSLVDRFQEQFKSQHKLNNNGLTEALREEIILRAQRLLEPRYYHIWAFLSPGEKMALYDLAEDGMVNVKNKNLIIKLHARGLIYIDPYPRVFTEGFRNFILTSIRSEEAELIQRRLSQKGNWSNLRLVFLSLLLALGVFVFVIQGQSIDQVLAIITSLVAVVPAVFRLFQGGISFKGSKPSIG